MFFRVEDLDSRADGLQRQWCLAGASDSPKLAGGEDGDDALGRLAERRRLGHDRLDASHDYLGAVLKRLEVQSAGDCRRREDALGVHLVTAGLLRGAADRYEVAGCRELRRELGPLG